MIMLKLDDHADRDRGFHGVQHSVEANLLLDALQGSGRAGLRRIRDVAAAGAVQGLQHFPIQRLGPRAARG